MDLAPDARPRGGPGGGDSVPATRPAGNGGLVDPPRPLPRSQAGLDADVRRPA